MPRSLHMLAAFCFSVSVLAFFAPLRAQAEEPLRIGYSDWPGWHLWEVVREKGLFDKAGVKVEMVWMEYGPSMEAFAAGKLDGCAMTNGDAMVTGASGKQGTCIILNDYSAGNDMVVVAPNKGINEFKDLKGKKIGVELNLVDHLLILKALEAHGMSESDVTLVNFATPETPQALASGGVDAIGSYYPFSGQALKQVAGSKTVFTSKEAPGLIYDCLFVSKESLVSRRAEWAKVVDAWFEGVKFLNAPETRGESIKIMAARASTTPEEYAAFLSGTHIMTLEEQLKAWKKGDGLDSIYGSNKIADDFNTRHKVYPTAQDTESYLDPSVVLEYAKSKGVAIP